MKTTEIGPTLPFVHVTVPRRIADHEGLWCSYTGTAATGKALTSHSDAVILQERRWDSGEVSSTQLLHTGAKNHPLPWIEEQRALCGTCVSTARLCAMWQRTALEGKALPVSLTHKGTNSPVSPRCPRSYSFIITDFGQSAVVAIIT